MAHRSNNDDKLSDSVVDTEESQSFLPSQEKATKDKTRPQPASTNAAVGENEDLRVPAPPRGPRTGTAAGVCSGIRDRKLTEKGSPGPVYLIPSNITRTGRDGSPVYSIRGRLKDPKPSQTPGPGTYHLEEAVAQTFPAAPSYSMSARTEVISKEQRPGPTAYTLPPMLGPKTVGKTTAPNFSFKGRSEKGTIYEDLKKTPGPGTYNAVDPNLHLSSLTEPRNRKAPAFSFGIQHREFTGEESPGPAYLIPSNFTRTGRDGSPVYSIRGRLKDPKPSQTPGPGTYHLEEAVAQTFPAAPSYSMSARTEVISKEQRPGPTAYTLPPMLGPKTVGKTTAPNFSFKGRSEKGTIYEDLKKTPGPGTYNAVDPNLHLSSLTEPRNRKAPAFSFGIQHREFTGEESPGPAYLIPSNFTRTGRDGSPVYSIRGRLKDPKPSQTPGPGTYHLEEAVAQTFPAAPSYSMSARTEVISKEQRPGPTAYTLPPMLGPKTVGKTTAPNFSFKGRSEKGTIYEDLKKTPGPGTYNAVDPNLHLSSLTEPRNRKAPAFSFGIQHREFTGEESPGPAYLIPANFTRTGHDGSPVYSIRGRLKDPKPSQTPGPGTYHLEEAVAQTFPAAPSYSMSARTEVISKEQRPGPTAYTLPPMLGPKTVGKTTAPNFSFKGRSEKGTFYEDFNKTPGPGTYSAVDPDIYKPKSPQYSISGRNFPGDMN